MSAVDVGARLALGRPPAPVPRNVMAKFVSLFGLTGDDGWDDDDDDKGF